MELNKLSLGNCMNTLDGKLTHVTKTWIKYNGFSNELDFECFNYKSSEVKPIPLTEEWLIKFGFGKVDGCDNHYQFKDSFEYAITTEDNKYYFNIEKYEGQCLYIEVKYVHQLQNLYFSLTNKELTIK